jgi:hypothetical protein
MCEFKNFRKIIQNRNRAIINKHRTVAFFEDRYNSSLFSRKKETAVETA